MNNTFRVLQGHWLEVAKQIPDQSVHVCVTSPPYYGLRSYGSEPQVWYTGTCGLIECADEPEHVHVECFNHSWQPIKQYKDSWRRGERSAGFYSDQRHGEFTVGIGDGSAPELVSVGAGPVRTAEELSNGRWTYTDVCAACGAWRGELGQEPSPAMYVEHLVQVFAEVWRVLRPDGTLWVNIGDAYYNYRPGKHDDARAQGYNRERTTGTARDIPSFTPKRGMKLDGYKEKDLMLIPWQFAIAMRQWGWYVRSAIVWDKPNPLSESVDDRPTQAWEPILMFAKSEDVFYDKWAITELPTGNAHPRGRIVTRDGMQDLEATAAAKPLSAESRNNGSYRAATAGTICPGGRNKRNVWRMNVQGYQDKHYACVDDDTEMLTARGWSRRIDLRQDEIVAGYDMATQLLRWEPLESVHHYKVTDESMLSVTGRSISMMVTENHRMVIHRPQPRTGKWQSPLTVEAANFRYGHGVAVAADWLNNGESFDLTWAELLGWYIAEGYECRNSMDVEISQSLSANAPKVERLRNLLLTVTAEFSEATGERDWRGKRVRQTLFRVRGYAAAQLREFAPAKQLLPFVLQWNSPSARALLAGLIDGDGHRRPDGRASFIQKNVATADMVQALAVRAGYSSTRGYKESDEIYQVYFADRKIRSVRSETKGAGIRRVNYSGIVWCPTTPSGTWVARRNGRVFITGNSFCEELPETALKAGSSEVGCCAACGAPWSRIVLKPAKARNKDQTLESRWRHSAAIRGIDIDNAVTGDSITLGWERNCDCYAGAPSPCTVLDPFAGRGTTGTVAVRHGRNAVLAELQGTYVPMIRKNLLAEAPLWVKEIE